MLFVSKIGKQLFGGKFCFPPKFFWFEIWTGHAKDSSVASVVFSGIINIPLQVAVVRCQEGLTILL